MRPLAYPDSDAVLICFDISRPETLDSVIKKVSFWCDLISLCMRQHLNSAVTLRDGLFLSRSASFVDSEVCAGQLALSRSSDRTNGDRGQKIVFLDLIKTPMDI